MKVTAAVAREDRAEFSIESLELDAPRADEVLVRVHAVGLCHTDLVFKQQETGLVLPAVLGHEGAGVVEQVGHEVTKVAPGDHVLMTFRSCGACDRCGSGASAYCRDMPTLNYTGMRTDGSRALARNEEPVSSNFFGQSSFATHAITYQRNLVPVPSNLPLETYAPLGCGVQTGAGAIMRSLACELGSSLVVLGAGTVGLSAVLGAVLQGCSQIIVVEPIADRRTMALELGATNAIDPAVGDYVSTIRGIVPQGADYALDTTGHLSSIEMAFSYMGSRGELGLVGVPRHADATFSIPLVPTIASGFGVRGIIEGDSEPDQFIPELIRLHQEGRFPFDRLISTYRFEEINTAVADQHLGKCIKVVLEMDDVGSSVHLALPS